MKPAIRFANSFDIEALVKIWSICFGDSDTYIRKFIDLCFKPENTVVAEWNGNVVGVIYMLPGEMEGRKFMYGYAIGVLPDYRGNDICEKMHRFVQEHTQKNDWLYGLHPANEKLFTYYRKTGLRDMYALKVYEAETTIRTSGLKMDDMDTKTWSCERKEIFSPAVLWDYDMLHYIHNEIIHCGGFVKKVTFDEGERFIVGDLREGVVCIKETSMCEDEVLKYAEELCALFGEKHIRFYLPEKSSIGKSEIQILGFGERREDVYMNLFMD